LINEQPVPSFEKSASTSIHTVSDERRQGQLHCKEEIIKWLIGSVLLIELDPATASIASSRQAGAAQSSFQRAAPSGEDTSSSASSLASHSFISASMSTISSAASAHTLTSTSAAVTNTSGYGTETNQSDSFRDEEFYQPEELDSNSSNVPGSYKSNKQVIYKQVAQRVILSSMNNVNLVHEIIRNVAFFLNNPSQKHQFIDLFGSIYYQNYHSQFSNYFIYFLFNGKILS
jgi:hypothetical protein